MLKRVLKWIGLFVLLVVTTIATLYLVYVRPVIKKIETTEVIKYDPKLTLLLGGGGNSGILVSEKLVLVIDTKMNEAAAQMYRTVKDLAGTKPILVVNTHYHPDHTKGNKYYHGQKILAGGNYSEELWLKKAGRDTLPNEWLKDTRDIPMDDETVTLINQPRMTHTESDVFVYLHKRKMLFGGDVILNRQAPSLSGGAADPEAYLEAFDKLPKRFAIEKVVPGHGAIGGIEIIDNFRQFFNDMKIAAAENSRRDELVAKYKEWTQIPLMMSPGATINVIQKRAKNVE